MKSIYDVLSQKEGEYNKIAAEYRRMGETLSKLGNEIQAIRLTVKLLADTQEQDSGQELRLFSQPQMMRAVLLENGDELHLSEIIKRVEVKFGKRLEPRVTAAVLFRYSKRGSTFYKSKKPNTWGLLEFKGNTETKTMMEIVSKIA